MPRRKTHKLITLGTKRIVLDGQMIDYILKVSPRINGLRMEIRPATGLTVVVSDLYDERFIRDALCRKSAWILRHLSQPESKQLPLLPKRIGHGDSLLYQGRKIVLSLSDEPGNGLPELRGKFLYVYNNGDKNPAGKIEAWYREQARRVFTEKADGFKQQMGVDYRAILIRGQKTRWGSCSPRGNLSLNWKLLLAPELIIEYVIIHELVHLKHMNHSRNFWDMVARFCPDWKKRRQWLMAHEDELKAAADLGA